MIHFQAIDYLILAVYFIFVLGIGWMLRRQIQTGADFLTSGRKIPAWIAGLAFLSANLGAQEVIGMGACGAKYGMLTCHFYWLPAVAAMVFVGVFMMPFYSAARRTPLIAAIPKMLFPALVIAPGMIAISLHQASPEGFLPKAADGSLDYNMATPLMLMRYL